MDAVRSGGHEVVDAFKLLAPRNTRSHYSAQPAAVGDNTRFAHELRSDDKERREHRGATRAYGSAHA